jgi:predicted secreted acid phosphatase
MMQNVEIFSKLQEILNNEVYNSPAIVFDIDGTLIDDTTYQPIDYITSFYNYCLSLGLTVFIITARPSTNNNVKHTTDMLHDNGISGWKGIYFARDRSVDIPGYKLKSRKHIYDRGYTVLMSLGDNWFDIGKYGGFGVIVNKKKTTNII